MTGLPRRSGAIANRLFWALLLACLAAALVVAAWFMQPRTFTVAVGPGGGEDQRVVQALTEFLGREASRVRLKVLLTESATASTQAMREGRADLAVVRSDMAAPNGSTSLAVMRRFYPAIISSSDAHIQSIADLKGKRIALGQQPANNTSLAEAVLSHWNLAPGDYQLVPVEQGQLQTLITRGAVDAFFSTTFAGSRMSPRLRELMRGPWGAKLVVLGIDEPAALTTKVRGLEEGTIAKGTFGGNPTIPSDDVETISISQRLMASESVPEWAGAELARQVLALRDRRHGEMPELITIEAPLRNVRTLPVHNGAAQFYDGVWQSPIERYSTHLFIGLVLLGSLGSLWTGLKASARRVAQDQVVEDVDRLIALGDGLSEASDADARRAALSQADTVLKQAVSAAARGDIAPGVLAAADAAVQRIEKRANLRD